MSFFERGPRIDGQSDPSTRRSLRKLQEDPVRFAALLAGADSVVPRRRRRAGFFTMSGVAILVLLSAVEAPDLFAAVGLTSPHETTTEGQTIRTHQPRPSDRGRPAQRWATTPASSGPQKSASSPAKTPPPTMARTVDPSGPMARAAVPAATAPAAPHATGKAHGKTKQHAMEPAANR